MKKAKLKSILSDYLVLTLACLIFAMAWEGFLIPNEMSSGGLMGLCTVVQYASFNAIPASLSYIVINIILIVLSVFIFGIGFGFRTVYSIAVSTLALHFIGQMDFLHSVEGNFFYVREDIMIPVIAGFLEAAGVGLIIRHGGSTGGTDIVALMVNKYWPVSMSKVFLVSDFIVISSLLLLPDKSFADMVYGYEMMVTFSLTIDFIIGGKKSSYQLFVFSDRFEQIADHITKAMDRGVTILKAQGWYTKKDKNVMLIIISKKQFPELSRVIKETDPKAFMSVTQTGSVYGEGFEQIKAGIKKSKNKK